MVGTVYQFGPTSSTSNFAVTRFTAGESLDTSFGTGGTVTTNFNGNDKAQKYSTASKITPDNVKNLGVAWSVRTGDVSQGGAGNIPKTAWQSTPLFVNNTVYVSTPFYRIFAVEPDTGKVK